MRVRISFRPEWWLGSSGRESVGQILPILHGIRRSGSIAKAARGTGRSYRHVWGVIGQWKEILGQPLVVAVQGRGTWLTPAGECLLRIDHEVRERVESTLFDLAQEIEAELTAATRTGSKMRTGEKAGGAEASASFRRESGDLPDTLAS